MTVRRHTLDVYGTQLWLATTPADWRTIRRRFADLDEDPGAAGLSHLVEGTPASVVLWVDVANHPTRLDLIDTVAHEATHAASQILDSIGHTLIAQDEPHAYLVGWLVRWMLLGLEV